MVKLLDKEEYAQNEMMRLLGQCLFSGSTGMQHFAIIFRLVHICTADRIYMRNPILLSVRFYLSELASCVEMAGRYLGICEIRKMRHCTVPSHRFIIYTNFSYFQTLHIYTYTYHRYPSGALLAKDAALAAYALLASRSIGLGKGYFQIRPKLHEPRLKYQHLVLPRCLSMQILG